MTTARHRLHLLLAAATGAFLASRLLRGSRASAPGLLGRRARPTSRAARLRAADIALADRYDRYAG